MKLYYANILSFIGFKLIPVLASLQKTSAATFPIEKDIENKIYFAIELDDGIIPSNNPHHSKLFSNNEIPASWTYEEPITAVPNHFLFSIPKDHQYVNMLFDIGDHAENIPLSSRSPLSSEHALLKRYLTLNGVRSLEVFEPRQLYKRAIIPPDGKIDSSVQAIYEIANKFNISDPIFPDQWHLFNPVQMGHDINVTGVWEQGVTGNGVSVCVVDDGLDMDSSDLKNNFFPDGSWDFNDPGPLPKPRLSDDRHGTRCAGEIAAVKNDVCGLGIAYQAKVAGVRILSKRILPSDEALAINFAMDKNDIYSCSWGPSDNGQTMEGPPAIVKKAMINAVHNGRDKKGNIYVFASGNGGSLDDNCNFDGYTNSIYSITVAAIDRKGLHPSYSESCSANMVVTYSSGSGDYIHTTDVNGQCATTHGGTSAAAPIAAGIISLVLEVNPKLTWRDVQYLTWDTAVPVNTREPGWQTTPAGKKFHHAYGYGKLDAYAIVERAKTWKNVKPQSWYFSPTHTENANVPEELDKPVEFTIKISEKDLKNANLARLEHIQVHVNAESSRRGSLRMFLTSPAGVVSEIMPNRKMDPSRDGVRNWNFMSVAHWGEPGIGDWKLSVQHGPNARSKTTSKLIDWSLILWGESIDPSKAEEFTGNPSSSKPSDENGQEEATSQSSIISTATSNPVESTSTSVSTTAISEPTDTNSSEEGTDGSEETEEGEDKDSGLFGSVIPTFGMSKNTAAWVYGSGLIILVFIGSITGYLLYLRRKRSRESGNYKGFDPLIFRRGNGDPEEYGEELDYLNPEFSLSDNEDDLDLDEDIDDDASPYQPNSSFLSKPSTEAYRDAAGTGSSENNGSSHELSVGKKAVDLYSSVPLAGESAEETSKKQSGMHEEEDLFQLGSDEENASVENPKK